MKLNIKKGDTVEVIAGNDKGMTGRVLAVYPKEMKILVEGVNIVFKATRPSQQDQKGGIREIERPIHYSNVMLLDQEKNPTRIGVRHEEKGGRDVAVRYAKTTGNDL